MSILWKIISWPGEKEERFIGLTQRGQEQKISLYLKILRSSLAAIWHVLYMKAITKSAVYTITTKTQDGLLNQSALKHSHPAVAGCYFIKRNYITHNSLGPGARKHGRWVPEPAELQWIVFWCTVMITPICTVLLAHRMYANMNS